MGDRRCLKGKEQGLRAPVEERYPGWTSGDQ